MTTEPLEFWAAVFAMAAITYLTRALPFLLTRREQSVRRTAKRPTFAALGPALLAGIAAVVIVPDVLALPIDARALPYIGGLLATGLCVRWLGNAGVAVIAGVLTYGGLMLLTG